MTNGEKIKEIFPYMTKQMLAEKSNIFMWWNAEYKESTTKNDSGVDCIVDVLGSYTDLDIPYKREIAENILAKLPSVTSQEPRWISVSERLPDTDDEVLCWYEYYHWSQEKVLPEYGLGSYLKETSSWFGEVANGHKVRVIAWMPLPTPYEPQESEEA